jgi:hypothetical protein
LFLARLIIESYYQTMVVEEEEGEGAQEED